MIPPIDEYSYHDDDADEYHILAKTNGLTIPFRILYNLNDEHSNCSLLYTILPELDTDVRG